MPAKRMLCIEPGVPTMYALAGAIAMPGRRASGSLLPYGPGPIGPPSGLPLMTEAPSGRGGAPGPTMPQYVLPPNLKQAIRRAFFNSSLARLMVDSGSAALPMICGSRLP